MKLHPNSLKKETQMLAGVSRLTGSLLMSQKIILLNVNVMDLVNAYNYQIQVA